MLWIYISPHLDDAVFSCGGLIRQQVDAGEQVEIWTVCAGDPPDGFYSPFAEELHIRWSATGEASPGAGTVAARRDEDLKACGIVGANAQHLPIPDCIYRRAGLDYWGKRASAHPADRLKSPTFLYPDVESIFGPVHALETGLIEQTAAHLGKLLPEEARLVAPLTLGGHVDHRLARGIVERLALNPWFYADFPYAAGHLDAAGSLAPPGWGRQSFPLSRSELEAWAQSILAHRSQVSSFWLDAEAAREALSSYSRRLGGGALWAPPDERQSPGSNFRSG